MSWTIPSREEAEEFTKAYLDSEEGYYEEQDCKEKCEVGGAQMSDREKVIKGLEMHEKKRAGVGCLECPYAEAEGGTDDWCIRGLHRDILALLKEQEARELTIDEWREWKANPKRNPICELWENDTSPMWILNPNDVHEPALLMGKLKLFTGKPTFEQCKEVKWK